MLVERNCLLVSIHLPLVTTCIINLDAPLHQLVGFSSSENSGGLVGCCVPSFQRVDTISAQRSRFGAVLGVAGPVVQPFSPGHAQFPAPPPPAPPSLRTDSPAPRSPRLRPGAPRREELRMRGGMFWWAGVPVTASDRAALGLRASVPRRGTTRAP